MDQPDVLGLELEAGLQILSDAGFEFVALQMTTQTADDKTARIVRQRIVNGKFEILFAYF